MAASGGGVGADWAAGAPATAVVLAVESLNGFVAEACSGATGSAMGGGVEVLVVVVSVMVVVVAITKVLGL